MPKQNPVPPRGAIIGAVFGTLIGAFFGRVWLSMAAAGLPRWRAAIEVAGWVVLGVFVVAGVFVALNVPRTPVGWGGKRPRKAWAAWFGVVIAVEIALLAVGQTLLKGNIGHPEWMPVWMLLWLARTSGRLP